MKAPKPDAALAAFRGVDFNWAIRLQDVWRNPTGDVPQLHQNARRELLDEVERMRQSADDASPLGRFIVGEAGSGKTHLLGAVRQELARKGLAFILVDMTDVSDFWECVAQGYLNSLQAPYLDGKAQYHFLLEKLIERVPQINDVAKSLVKLSRYKAEQLNKNIKNFLTLLRTAYPTQAYKHQDAIRALLCLNSDEFGIVNAGLAWLQGLEMDENLRKDCEFQKAREDPRAIVRALSWIISLAGPSVLAFDQLDPIVHQVSRQNVPEDPEEQNAARLIIDKIGNGLAAIRETTLKTLVVVSCLEASYQVLTKEVLHSNLDRFHPPTRLQYQPGSTLNQLLIEARLSAAYEQEKFAPPYSTWPFTTKAIGGLRGESPRRLFQLCEGHRRRCIESGKVEELHSFDSPRPTNPAPARDEFANLDQEFARRGAEADLNKLRDEKNEDDQLAPLYQTALQCLIHEHAHALSEDVVAFVDQEFGGGRTTRPLHARLRVQFQKEGDREEHYCVRVLLKKHHAAYRSRLKAAITQAGIDRRLTFRRLTVIRFDEPPGGAATQNLTKQFADLGGRFYCPGEEELRTLYAIAQLAQAKHPQWHAWLAERKPVSNLGLGHALAPSSLFDAIPASEAHQKGETPTQAPDPRPPVHELGNAIPRKVAKSAAARTPTLPESTETSTVAGAIFLGHRLIGDEARQAVSLPIPLLEKHTFVVAGAGSGKTVLLKRLIEEAALAGIPSIVIDGANDLATLGEAWPNLPADFGESEHARAAAYLNSVEVVIWTPGVERGNPLQLNPLPDFSVVRDDAEALEESIEVAVDGLADLIATGSPTVKEKKIGVLRSVLRYFAKDGGGSVESLIALLREPPHEALLGIDKEEKLARDLADTFTVRRENNPLLRSSGAALDPADLFGDANPNGKTRVSVVNLAGLGSIENQQQFLNQLAMTLFDWAKKNPTPPGRAVRGLFVLDEAKDFVPGRTASACKRSLMRCAAQLRKYHVGMIFATQNPKDLENTVSGNCSTHFYGKFNSPTAIDTVRNLMIQKGGTGSDIANLPRGVFYVHNADADFKQPTKIKVPLCLSHHRANSPNAEEIIDMALRTRSS